MHFEDGLRAIESLAHWYKGQEGQRNEATTRLHLIDALFFECLGWSKEDVIAEEAHGKEYADYTFLAPRRVLIVEAKREGNYFELPIGEARLEIPIPVLTRTYDNVAAALKQAADYCQDRGVPFGVVTNGHQLIAIVATRNDGTPPLEGRAIVFASIDQMQREFLELWNALSKSGLEQKRLLHKLIEGLPVLPQKLSAKLKPYPGVAARNIIQNDLQILSDIVLEDIIPSPELESTFLKECYAQSGALSQFSLASRQILEARYAAMFDGNAPSPVAVPAVTKRGLSPELLSVSMARRPILLLGDVGVGKTTFIRNLIAVEAAGILQNGVALHLDLGSQAALAIDLRVHVIGEIERQLRNNYGIDIHERDFVRGTYSADLQRFQKGIYGELRTSAPDEYRRKEIEELASLMRNREGHVRKSIEQIVRERHKQVVIFLDNADQRNDPTQEAAFLIANEIAQQWPAVVFISLRPETFNRSQKTGALSGYHAKAFTIAPPRIDTVIEKRLYFALKITQGQIPVARLQNIGIRLENLTTILRILLQSLRWDSRLFEFLDNISGGNVRAALMLLVTFIGSGHVNTQKMLDMYSRKRRYGIPIHEMLRAVIYGDGVHYDPDRSAIVNIFDISTLDGSEHFLLPLTIGVLDRSGAGSTDGFVETERVYDSLQAMGFTPDQIDFSISRGVEKKLIETSGRQVPRRGDQLPTSLRATPSGLYHAYRIASKFSYVDAVVVDTPILDDAVREATRPADDLGDRLTRAESFIEYLDSMWGPIAQCAVGFDWQEASESLKAEIAAIRWSQLHRSPKRR
jgi:hypothetical protein